MKGQKQMFTSILVLSITILLTMLIGLALVHQAWACNGNKHTQYTIIARDTILTLPIMYIFLVLILTLA